MIDVRMGWILIICHTFRHTICATSFPRVSCTLVIWSHALDVYDFTIFFSSILHRRVWTLWIHLFHCFASFSYQWFVFYNRSIRSIFQASIFIVCACTRVCVCVCSANRFYFHRLNVRCALNTIDNYTSTVSEGERKKRVRTHRRVHHIHIACRVVRSCVFIVFIFSLYTQLFDKRDRFRSL